MHIVAKEGKGETTEELKEQSKQTVNTPITFESLGYQTSILSDAYHIMFGAESIDATKMANMVKKSWHTRP